MLHSSQKECRFVSVLDKVRQDKMLSSVVSAGGAGTSPGAKQDALERALVSDSLANSSHGRPWHEAAASWEQSSSVLVNETMALARRFAGIALPPPSDTPSMRSSCVISEPLGSVGRRQDVSDNADRHKLGLKAARKKKRVALGQVQPFSQRVSVFGIRASSSRYVGQATGKRGGLAMAAFPHARAGGLHHTASTNIHSGNTGNALQERHIANQAAFLALKDAKRQRQSTPQARERAQSAQRPSSHSPVALSASDTTRRPASSMAALRSVSRGTTKLESASLSAARQEYRGAGLKQLAHRHQHDLDQDGLDLSQEPYQTREFQARARSAPPRRRCASPPLTLRIAASDGSGGALGATLVESTTSRTEHRTSSFRRSTPVSPAAQVTNAFSTRECQRECCARAIGACVGTNASFSGEQTGPHAHLRGAVGPPPPPTGIEKRRAFSDAAVEAVTRHEAFLKNLRSERIGGRAAADDDAAGAAAQSCCWGQRSVCACVRACVRTRMYVCMYVRTYVRTHTHT